jgi:hypothetical protein
MPKPIREYSVQEIFNVSGNSTHLTWLLTATDEQLVEYIPEMSGNEVLHRAALAERDKRHFNRLKEPHWSITPGIHRWYSCYGVCCNCGVARNPRMDSTRSIREYSRQFPAATIKFSASDTTNIQNITACDLRESQHKCFSW